MEKTRFKLLESIGWESVGRDQRSAGIVRSSQHPGQHPAPRTRSLGRNFKVVLPNFVYPMEIRCSVTKPQPLHLLTEE